MKKLLFMVLMIPLLANASNWVYVDKNSYGDTFFVDSQSTQRSGNSVTFWEKVNYGTRGKYGDLSAKLNSTINCKTREKINRYSMFYDDLDNTGKLTTSGATTSEQWEPIAPDTITEGIMKFVCKR